MSNSSYFWTNLQKQLLAQSYKAGGLSQAMQALPDKKKATIATQAHRLKLTTPKPRKPK